MNRKKWAVSIILLCCIVICIAAIADAADTVQVTYLEGSARATTKAEPRGKQVRKGDPLTTDHEVQVADRSRIELRFPDGTLMRFAGGTRVKLGEIRYSKKTGEKTMQVNLSVGKVWANVRKLTTKDSRVEVRTTNAVAGVRGTVYRMNAERDNSALVKVYDGAVDVSGAQPKDSSQQKATAPVPVPGPQPVSPPYHEVSMEEWHVIVKSFQQVSISADGKPSKPTEFDPKADSDDWVRWNQERDRQIAPQ